MAGFRGDTQQLIMELSVSRSNGSAHQSTASLQYR